MAQPDWLIITRDAEDELRVVSVGGKPAEWRRLMNVLRGAGREAAQAAITTAIDTNQVQLVHGGFAGCAIPVDTPPGTTSATAAIYLPTSVDPSTTPAVGSWEWRPQQEELPPTLHPSPVAVSLLGVSEKHRDRTVYGPADIWTRTKSMSDVLESMSFVFDAAPAETRTAQTVVQTEDNDFRVLNTAECVIGVGTHRIIRSVVWEDRDVSSETLIRRSTDMELASILANASDQSAAVLDIRFPVVPIICKWITPHTPGLGHGASTGQTSGWNPEDLPRVLEYIQTLAQLKPGDEVPELTGIRARRAGGGWVEGKGRAFPLAPTLHPTVWVVVGQRVRDILEDTPDSAQL